MNRRQEKAEAGKLSAIDQKFKYTQQLLNARKKPLMESVHRNMRGALEFERVRNLVLMAGKKNPRLFECTANTLISSVSAMLTLGLEPGGALQHCYLVPFKNKGVYECIAIIGYRGYIELAHRATVIRSVQTRAVWEGDYFDVCWGSEPRIEHRPDVDGFGTEQRSLDAFRGAYCITELKNGAKQMDYMTRAEINHIRDSSPSARTGRNGPWFENVNNYQEMARKTVLRRAAKLWPMCPDLASAWEHEDSPEGEYGQVVEGSLEESTAPAALGSMHEELEQAARDLRAEKE